MCISADADDKPMYWCIPSENIHIYAKGVQTIITEGQMQKYIWRAVEYHFSSSILMLSINARATVGMGAHSLATSDLCSQTEFRFVFNVSLIEY